MNHGFRIFDWLYVCLLKVVRPCDRQGSPIRHRRRKIRNEVLGYYKAHPTADATLQSVLDYLRKRPDAVFFPDRFRDKYDYCTTTLHYDQEGTPYWPMAADKRLYFLPDTYQTVQRAVTCMRMEQDADSPHRFLVPGFDVDENDIIADVGCAEGLFSLMCVDRVKRIYLFESDPVWINILCKTFGIWLDKVKIVSQPLSDHDGDGCMRLDTYFRKEGVVPTFVKLDVEGRESKMLESLSGLLDEGHPIKIAACTYHRQEEYEELQRYAQGRGYRSCHSKGWMLFGLYDRPHPPYFRRGIIRIWANEKKE